MPTGKVRLVVNEETKLVELSFSAPGESVEEHDKMAEETREFYKNLLAINPDVKFKVLVDLSNAGIPTKHATDLYIATLSDKHIERTAIFGMSKAIQSVINFIVSAAGKGENVKFFIDREQALKYLQS